MRFSYWYSFRQYSGQLESAFQRFFLMRRVDILSLVVAIGGMRAWLPGCIRVQPAGGGSVEPERPNQNQHDERRVPEPDESRGHFQGRYCFCISTDAERFEQVLRKAPTSGRNDKEGVQRRILCKSCPSLADRRRCGRRNCRSGRKLPGRIGTSCCQVDYSRRNMAGRANPRHTRANDRPARQFYKGLFLPVSNPPYYLKV